MTHMVEDFKKFCPLSRLRSDLVNLLSPAKTLKQQKEEETNVLKAKLEKSKRENQELQNAHLRKEIDRSDKECKTAKDN